MKCNKNGSSMRLIKMRPVETELFPCDGLADMSVILAWQS